MRYVLLLVLMVQSVVFAQKEGQGFCAGDNTGEYFPLDIEKKKLLWSDTHYFESTEGTKPIEGKTYQIVVQAWKNNDIDTLYLRKDGTRVMEYVVKTGNEQLRYDSSFKEGHSWKGKDATFTVLSYDAKLLTKYCRYTGLMSLKAEYKDVTYTFFYLKGYGYVGATRDGKLISCASPEW